MSEFLVTNFWMILLITVALILRPYRALAVIIIACLATIGYCPIPIIVIGVTFATLMAAGQDKNEKLKVTPQVIPTKITSMDDYYINRAKFLDVNGWRIKKSEGVEKDN